MYSGGKRNRRSPVERYIDYDFDIHQHLLADRLLMFNIERKRTMYDQFVSDIHSKDPSKEIEGTCLFDKILEKDPRLVQFLTSKDVDVLIGFLKSKGSILPRDPKPIEAHSASILAKFITWCQVSEETRDKAIKYLVPLLIVDNFEVRIQAMPALTVIANKFTKASEDIINCGALSNLMVLVRIGKMYSDKVLSYTAMFLGSLCAGKPYLSDDEMYVVLHIVKICLRYVLMPEVCFPLVKLSEGRCMELEQEDCLILTELINPKELGVLIVLSALEVIGNIVMWGSSSQIQCMNNAVMKSLREVLFHRHKSLRKEACWTISNFLAENAKEVEVDSRLIDGLCHCLDDDELDVKIEAAWAILNLTYNHNATRLMQGKCMETLFHQQSECPDLEIVGVCRHAIQMLHLAAEEKLLSLKLRIRSSSPKIE